MVGEEERYLELKAAYPVRVRQHFVWWWWWRWWSEMGGEQLEF
jgi:hypothetical protein